jgi:fimbrial chaperone protein
MKRLCVSLLAFLLLLALSEPPDAQGGWRVVPIRLDFDQRSRSGVLNIVNDGSEPVHFVTEVKAWTQDDDGRDVYTAVDDLVYFPRALTIPPGEERMIRAGIKAPPVGGEKAYRLFIREKADSTPTSGSAVAIAIQFGVPVFAKPVIDKVEGDIAGAQLRKGQVEFTVRNSGASHFRITTITVLGADRDGQALFAQESTGWYLLGGASRLHSVTVPIDACSTLRKIDIQVNTDRIKLNRTLHVDEADCP